ncbi:hypothetical protein I350_00232 [Cryptococcus amylolentus CBS 6273]|uniref:BHLH domain-containing protein n=1 Tax=Cryptococcus amylolentus CBS 6273 TaxID=1296118 RepID=A0A1E3KGM1_9TREE|nr:hypothetical protein I350_00232 [Cryptococcus amylolentus CBS 6273]
MSTPHGASPSASYLHQDAELYSLDFLGLSELDAPMSDVDSPKPAGLANSARRNQGHAVDAGEHVHGKSDVDEAFQGGIHQNGGHTIEVDEGVMDGKKQEFIFNGHEYDALQAAMLQQQLSSFHMQSPLGFDINNPPFHLSQMLSSPAGQALQLHNSHSQQSHASRENDHGSGSHQHGASGTSAPGSAELISPMHLEMLSWQHMDGNDSYHAPAISPALSHKTSHSAYDSPVSHAPYNAHSHRSSFSALPTKSPLEQLQEQQAQFQEQLALLQQQQLEMQATAAAVMAAQSSPYMLGHGPSPSSSRPSTTPAVTQSPGGIFSPLTSPALEATNRLHRSHSGHHNHHFSPAFNAQQQRTPHPLSTMSSPALNPVGSSGGANQTLSPALTAQNSADMDPEYVRALVGMLDSGHTPPSGDPLQPPYQSPSMASTSTAGHTTVISSPALHATGSGTGPHRQSLPSKTRPSPMLKPTNHRSNHRNSVSGHYSVPSSPAVTKYHPDASMPPTAMNSGLPPSALEHHKQVHSSASTTSTPSPVDLSQIMPPPPVPAGSSKSRKGVMPMTPASLMNLGSGNGSKDGGQSVPLPPPPKRAGNSSTGADGGQITAEGSGSGQTASTEKGAKKQGGKKGNAGKPVPVGGKRALAARPQAVGVRVATKAAAAAAAAALSLEPENRKISHKAAEQKRRDSLKAGFDELRLLLPPINTEALDPLSGEPIPGSSAPRLLPKSSLVPDDNPNRGVSKVALLRFGNEYIEKLQERVDRRDVFIEKLREEVERLRQGGQEEVRGEDGEDLLDYDWREGEDDEFGEDKDSDEEGEEGEEEEDVMDEGMEVEDDGSGLSKRPTRTKSFSTRSPGIKPTRLSLSTASGSDATTTRGKKGE